VTALVDGATSILLPRKYDNEKSPFLLRDTSSNACFFRRHLTVVFGGLTFSLFLCNSESPIMRRSEREHVQ